MLALILSYFVVAYLLIPSSIFRLSSVFVPLKKFQRTRREEIVFAVLVSIAPFLVACAISTLGGWNFSMLDDWKVVFASSYSEEIFRTGQGTFWTSLGNVAAAQVKFLVLYYVLAAVQALIFALLVNQYGRWHRKSEVYR
jgi:hypothetical protein